MSSWFLSPFIYGWMLAPSVNIIWRKYIVVIDSSLEWKDISYQLLIMLTSAISPMNAASSVIQMGARFGIDVIFS